MNAALPAPTKVSLEVGSIMLYATSGKEPKVTLRCALTVFRFGKQGCRLTSFPVPFEAVAKIRMVPLRRIADGEEEEAWYGCNSFSGCMLVNQSRFIAKLTVKECLAGLDGMRVALNDDDKIAMQEAQGSSELMDMILSGEKKPGRKRTQQTTDADEVAAQSKAFQFMPSSFGASKAGGRNIQRCMEDSLNLYRLSFPLQNIFDEHGNVKSTGVAWEDTVKRSPEFFSSYFGHAKKGDRSALIFKYLEDIKRALMEKPARKHGFFQAGVRDPQMISDDERHCMSMPQKSQLCMLCDGFPWMDKTVFLIFFCVELLVFWWAQGIHKSMVPQSPGRT